MTVKRFLLGCVDVFLSLALVGVILLSGLLITKSLFDYSEAIAVLTGTTVSMFGIVLFPFIFFAIHDKLHERNHQNIHLAPVY